MKQRLAADEMRSAAVFCVAAAIYKRFVKFQKTMSFCEKLWYDIIWTIMYV